MIAMIVEDDVDMNQLLKMIVHDDMKIPVEQFYDGDEAIKRLESDQEKPGLIILDLHLSNISGWEVFDAIRQKTKIPVAIVTADRIAAINFVDKADAVFTKPWNMMEFIVKLTSLIAQEEQKGNG